MHIRTNPVLNKLFQPLILFCRWLGRNYPELLVKIRYFFRFKKFLNLKNPSTLNEKILYQSLKTEIGLRTKLTDKWRVREYVDECGLSHILVKSYGAWKNANDIDFDSLPQSFVLKPNHGCGDLIFVKDKNEIDKGNIVKQINHDLSQVYGELEGGIHYFDIQPVVVAEEMIYNDEVSALYSSSIIDYKIWCFNGKAHYIMTCTNRNKKTVELTVYDREWNRHPEFSVSNNDYLLGDVIPKPQNLDNMLEMAELLSKPFDVVRVDLYNLAGIIYFGEMTFTSLGGLMDYYSNEFQNLAGSLIDLKDVNS